PSRKARARHWSRENPSIRGSQRSVSAENPQTSSGWRAVMAGELYAQAGQLRDGSHCRRRVACACEHCDHHGEAALERRLEPRSTLCIAIEDNKIVGLRQSRKNT